MIEIIAAVRHRARMLQRAARADCRAQEPGSHLPRLVDVERLLAPGQFHLRMTLMKVLVCLLALLPVMSGCISSSNPPPPKQTTVIVPADSKTTVICQDGTNPPCQ